MVVQEARVLFPLGAVANGSVRIRPAVTLMHPALFTLPGPKSPHFHKRNTQIALELKKFQRTLSFEVYKVYLYIVEMAVYQLPWEESSFSLFKLQLSKPLSSLCSKSLGMRHKDATFSGIRFDILEKIFSESKLCDGNLKIIEYCRHLSGVVIKADVLLYS